MRNPSAVESLADVDARLGEEQGRLPSQLETEALSKPASTQVAAGLSLVVGLLLAIMGAAHLHGVLTVAANRGYDYDFRLAGLLLVGSTLVFGVRCAFRACAVWPAVDLLRGTAPRAAPSCCCSSSC